MIKKIMIVLLVALVAIQFFRPTKNEGNALSKNDIAHTVIVSPEVQKILEVSCNDCHSNNTVYPWYTAVQPIGWWLNNHVDEGKDEINFSEFNTYSMKRKLHKFKEIKEQVEEGEMPMSSYTMVHGEAKFSEEQKQLILKWVDESRDSLERIAVIK